MVTILPKDDSQPYKGLGDFLSTGLSGLAQNKLKNIQNQQLAKAYEAYNISPQQAQVLAPQGLDAFRDFAKQYELPAQQQNQNNVMENLQQLLSGNNQSQGGGLDQTQGMSGPKRRPNPQDEYHKAVIDLKKQNVDLKKQENINKRFDPIIREHQKDFVTNNKLRLLSEEYLKTLEEAGEEGSLPHPMVESFMKTLAEDGIRGYKVDLRSLYGQKPEVLRKIGAQMVNVATAGMPGVKTNLRVENFMKAIPSLSQTPEGQRVIAEQMLLLNKLSDVEFEVDSELIDKNNGEIPSNYGTLAPKMVRERQNEIMKNMRKDYSDFGVESKPTNVQTSQGNFEVESEVNALPDAASSKGERYFDTKSNSVVISNGKSWVKYTGQSFE